MKYALVVMLATADIVPLAATLAAVTLLVSRLAPMILPEAFNDPDVLRLPPVMLAVVVTGPVRLTRLPVYVGKKAATLALP